jgi:hypothetical protein
VTLAAILFGVAALGGVAMAIMRFSGKELPPMGLAILHGLAAAAGLIALIIAVMGGASSKATIALVLFLGAAIGGFMMFSYHLRRKALPIPYVIIHGLVAVVAFVVLLLAVFAVRG